MSYYNLYFVVKMIESTLVSIAVGILCLIVIATHSETISAVEKHKGTKTIVLYAVQTVVMYLLFGLLLIEVVKG